MGWAFFAQHERVRISPPTAPPFRSSNGRIVCLFSNRPKDVFQVETVLHGADLLPQAPGIQFDGDKFNYKKT